MLKKKSVKVAYFSNLTVDVEVDENNLVWKDDKVIGTISTHWNILRHLSEQDKKLCQKAQYTIDENLLPINLILCEMKKLHNTRLL
jgi:hypothetical protein